MRFNPIPLITFCLLVSFSSLAQIANPQTEVASRYNLSLKSGTIIPAENITLEASTKYDARLGFIPGLGVTYGVKYTK